MRVFITGCARSGTTLVKNLFYAFRNVEVIDEEIGLRRFTALPEPEAKVFVAKRDALSIFSNQLPDEEIAQQLEIINEERIQVVNCLRQKAGVMKTGRGMTVSYERWKSSLRQASTYASCIAVSLPYEILCKHPDKMQDRVVTALGLEAEAKWSEYPDFVPPSAFANIDLQRFPGYGRRSIKRHIGKYEKRMLPD